MARSGRRDSNRASRVDVRAATSSATPSATRKSTVETSFSRAVNPFVLSEAAPAPPRTMKKFWQCIACISSWRIVDSSRSIHSCLVSLGGDLVPRYPPMTQGTTTMRLATG